MFGFGPTDAFFFDEFIFNEENREEERRQRDYENGICRESCPDCGETLRFRIDAEKVRCKNCGGKFRVN